MTAARASSTINHQPSTSQQGSINHDQCRFHRMRRHGPRPRASDHGQVRQRAGRRRIRHRARNAKQAIEDNRLDATIYDSADALIDDPNVDAVVIASRNDVHLDPLLHTIAIGKPTFTEKPMTINGLRQLGRSSKPRWPRAARPFRSVSTALRPRLRRDEDLRRRRDRSAPC